MVLVARIIHAYFYFINKKKLFSIFFIVYNGGGSGAVRCCAAVVTTRPPNSIKRAPIRSEAVPGAATKSASMARMYYPREWFEPFESELTENGGVFRRFTSLMRF